MIVKERKITIGENIFHGRKNPLVMKEYLLKNIENVNGAKGKKDSSDEEEEDQRGKYQYIEFITISIPRPIKMNLRVQLREESPS